MSMLHQNVVKNIFNIIKYQIIQTVSGQLIVVPINV